MTQTLTAPASTQATTTGTLLRCGVVAGPVFAVVGLAQAALRDGFDLRHHALSLLSNGHYGWIQIVNFLVTGTLTVAAAVGLRRATGSTWAARMVGTFGAGMIGAGFFVADPMNGFPVGAAPGKPDPMTWHGGLHMVCGGIGFLALIAACMIIGRRFGRQGNTAWARYSYVTGVVFFAAFAGLSSGSATPAVNLAFVVAVMNALGWIAALCAHLRRG